MNERLMPAVEKVMAGSDSPRPPVKQETYELHDLLSGR